MSSAEADLLVPPCLLPQLLELERLSPAERAAFCTRALAPSTDPTHEAAAEVLRRFAKRGLEADALEAEARSAGLGEGTASALAHCWATQAGRRALLQQAVPGGLRSLTDLDWTFGVSASSSEHAAMGTTFVQLRLHTVGADGAPEYVHMELTLAKFYDFLHELEAAKAQLELA